MGRLKAFEPCEFEFECVCGSPPFACPILKGKRCPTCGPSPGLCKVRACGAARKGAGPSSFTEQGSA